MICCLFLGACVDGQDEDRWCGNRRLESGDLVVLSTDFSSSSVDVARPRCEGRWSGLLVGPGDLALRSGTSQFYVLDRSTNGSITAIDQAGDLRWQTALETCGAHDLIEVSAQWGVISCYDDDSLRFIQLETGMVSMGPSLLSEADSDGIPEMDRLALVAGEYLVVSLQRLGRADGYRPIAAGRIVRGRLSFESDAPPRVDSWEGLDIDGLENPVTALEVDGLSLTLGFAGNWQGDASSAGRASVEVDPLGVSARSFSAPHRLWQSAGSWWVGSATVPGSLEVETMRLVRELEEGPEEVWETSGFSVGGIAVAPNDSLYLAHRPNGAPSEILEFGSDGGLTARYPWPLKPWELLFVP